MSINSKNSTSDHSGADDDAPASQRHSSQPALYLVATPIGNLGDISQRAIEILQAVDVIAAEDTRHSQKLLNHLGINNTLLACHEHNEQQVLPKILDRLQRGQSVALISDAGTPLISDPGYRLVAQAHQHDIKVVPVPGACAAIAALSAAGLPTDRFVFEGFLPAKQQARLKALQQLSRETRTLVIYESCHRIVACLRDMCEVFGGERRLSFIRELTKTFETVKQSTLEQCLAWVQQDANQQRGEIVLVLAGAEVTTTSDEDLSSLLALLLSELPVKPTAALAAKITGRHKNECYKIALEIKDSV